MAGRFLAPLDLRVGHALEVVEVGGSHCYGWVADADEHRFVLVPSPDAGAAVDAAARASAVWEAAEIAVVEAVWRERIARVRRVHDEAG
jgi:hypothetical protein